MKDPFRTRAGECALDVAAIRDVSLKPAQIRQTVEAASIGQRLENRGDIVTVVDQTTDQVRADKSRGAGYETADDFVSRVAAGAGSGCTGTSHPLLVGKGRLRMSATMYGGRRLTSS